MEDKKRLSFGYEDTDKSIEVELYGLVFEIKNLDKIEEYEKTDKKDISTIEKQLEVILGEGAIEKINNKRISDGYNKMDLNIELNVLGCIFQTYARSMANNVLGRVVDTTNDINKEMGNMNNNFTNREDRRNYSRNNNYYRGNRRNYRRY